MVDFSNAQVYGNLWQKQATWYIFEYQILLPVISYADGLFIIEDKHENVWWMKDMKITYELKFQGQNFYKGERYNHPVFSPSHISVWLWKLLMWSKQKSKKILGIIEIRETVYLVSF